MKQRPLVLDYGIMLDMLRCIEDALMKREVALADEQFEWVEFYERRIYDLLKFTTDTWQMMRDEKANRVDSL